MSTVPEDAENVFDTQSPDNDDSIQTRSGVFRRIMARDLYELSKRVDTLEGRAPGGSGSLAPIWPHLALASVFFLMFAGAIVYFGYLNDRLAAQHRQDTATLRAEIDARDRSIGELRETVLEQSRAVRALSAQRTAQLALLGSSSSPAQPANPEPFVREPLPHQLASGQVVLIIASSPDEEEAIAMAKALETDGHASEVVRGSSGYFGVALGRFEFEKARDMKTFVVESGLSDTTPYLMNDEQIAAYVYP